MTKRIYPEEILDSIGEGIYTVDKDFRITFVNKAAENILGFSRDKIIGSFCKNIFSTHNCLENCPIRQVLESGENLYDFVTQLKNKKGQQINVRVNATLIWDKNVVTGGVIAFRDLSEINIINSPFDSPSGFCGIVGQSKVMREIFQLINDIHDTGATVFIQGESGTGKELLANAVQTTSLRKSKPFVKVNCSVFSPQLLASELFGHVKGAFTDAIQNRIGRFEMADTGTLFLDEVAEMSPQMQLQLLRVLQEGTFERVGESITRHTDVRIIAATNKDIHQAIKDGQFRQDLYYRLNVIPIQIPPLRERREDIPLLIEHFLKRFTYVYKKQIIDIDDNVMDVLLTYSWPGNVRELENVLEYAFVRTKNADSISLGKLPPSVKPISTPVEVVKSLPKESECAHILELLEKHKWNKSKVAEEMGIGRTTLWRKLKRMGLVDEE